ncbi:hypothetical protein [Azospirillum thermophilum]|nr:hypothetical protein [Azospirillum thermophilum]
METMMSTKTAARKTDEASAPASTPATPAASAPQPVPVRVYRAKTADLTFPEERTAKVVLPTELFLEADPATVAKRKGHQIDPSRPASHVAVMPNAKMLAETGNPYPAAGDHPSVVTGDNWRPYVAIAHHAFALLQERGEVGLRDVLDEAVKRAGFVQKPSYAESVVRDTLRDLACCGYAEAFTIGARKLYRTKEASK